MITRRDALLALTAPAIAALKGKRLILVHPDLPLYFRQLKQSNGKPRVQMTFCRKDAASLPANTHPASLKCFKNAASFSGIKWKWEVQ